MNSILPIASLSGSDFVALPIYGIAAALILYGFFNLVVAPLFNRLMDPEAPSVRGNPAKWIGIGLVILGVMFHLAQ